MKFEEINVALEGERIFKMFDKVMEHLSNTDEKVPISDVMFIVAKNIEGFFQHLRKENPDLSSLCEKSEMCITTSIAFNLAQFTSIREEVIDFMKGVESNDKPN